MKRPSDHFRRQVEAVKRRYEEDHHKIGESIFRDFLSAVNTEIERIKAEVREAKRSAHRIRLQALLAKMEASKVGLYRKFNRKPPEAGIAMPVEPPKGPLPKQGGAEAPLDFDDSRV